MRHESSRLILFASSAALFAAACSKPSSPWAQQSPVSHPVSGVRLTGIRGIFSSGWEMPSLIRLCAGDRHICEEGGRLGGYCSIEFNQDASRQYEDERDRRRIHGDWPIWIEGNGVIVPPPATVLEDRRKCHVVMTRVALVSDIPLAALRRAAAKEVRARDEQLKAQVVRAAVPTSAHRWVTDADYPPEALREHAEGMVRFRLAITPAGTVGDCTVTASSGNALLDATTCRLVSARARFEPAVKNGAAVEGNWAGAVRWVTPRKPSK